MPSTYDKRGEDLGYYSDTVNVTTVTVTSALVLLLPANPDRKGFTIYNVPANSLYLRFGQSLNGDTMRVGNDTSMEMVFPFVYRGPVYGRRNGTATGAAIVTEYT
jgi:hypothetical protein